VVEVSLPSSDSAKREQFRALLQNQTGIQQFSFCLGAPISDNGINTSLKVPELGNNSDYSIKILASDLDYLKTYGIQLLAGRWFFESEEKNLGSGIVVNETLVRILGLKTPAEAIGKKLPIGINKFEPEIIGVTKDFHTTSLHQSIGPVGILPFPYFYYAAAIRLEPGTLRSTLSKIESSFRKVYPDFIYSASFIDDQLAKLYKEDKKNYTLFKAFSIISIFICCIGLWGLIAFVVVRKTKEIGVRKVLGATVGNIVTMLSTEFVGLVLTGFLIAAPIAWYFMNRWLENFAYRITIEWWIFLLGALLATTIALLTISFQSIKAALSNPVKSLRSE
jgi:ABC-type antimicrobial peptide transport system permease subunit